MRSISEFDIEMQSDDTQGLVASTDTGDENPSSCEVFDTYAAVAANRAQQRQFTSSDIDPLLTQFGGIDLSKDKVYIERILSARQHFMVYPSVQSAFLRTVANLDYLALVYAARVVELFEPAGHRHLTWSGNCFAKVLETLAEADAYDATVYAESEHGYLTREKRRCQGWDVYASKLSYKGEMPLTAEKFSVFAGVFGMPYMSPEVISAPLRALKKRVSAMQSAPALEVEAYQFEDAILLPTGQVLPQCAFDGQNKYPAYRDWLASHSLRELVADDDLTRMSCCRNFAESKCSGLDNAMSVSEAAADLNALICGADLSSIETQCEMPAYCAVEKRRELIASLILQLSGCSF